MSFYFSISIKFRMKLFLDYQYHIFNGKKTRVLFKFSHHFSSHVKLANVGSSMLNEAVDVFNVVSRYCSSDFRLIMAQVAAALSFPTLTPLS